MESPANGVVESLSEVQNSVSVAQQHDPPSTSGTPRPTRPPLRPSRNHCRPRGSEALPAGIVSSTSSFETRPLWDIPAVRKKHHQRRQVNWVLTSLVSKLKGLAERKKLEDLTIGPVLTMYILTIMFLHTFGCCTCKRTYKIGGCDLSSTAPPCTRWIEMMAPGLVICNSRMVACLESSLAW
ncbi:hypothetical protein HN51_050916, partial [Arachis hypogaea]